MGEVTLKFEYESAKKLWQSHTKFAERFLGRKVSITAPAACPYRKADGKLGDPVLFLHEACRDFGTHFDGVVARSRPNLGTPRNASRASRNSIDSTPPEQSHQPILANPLTPS